MKHFKVLLTVLLSLCMLFTMTSPAYAEESVAGKTKYLTVGDTYYLRLKHTSLTGKATTSHKKVLKIKKIKRNQWKTTALKAGKSTVTVSFAGKKQKVYFVVKKPKAAPTYLYFFDNYKQVNMAVGDSLDVSRKLYFYAPKAKSTQLKYKSSNKSIVSITKNGTAKALKAGKATITVSYKKKKAKMTITVHELTVTANALPVTISNYNSFDQSLINQCQITNVSFEKTYYDYDNSFSLYMVLTGTKTFATEIASKPCKVGWKLYDQNNVVVKSGLFYTDSVNNGETFTTKQIITAKLSEGQYHLVLEDY
ncbi:MAG TPA: hypothetical protein DCQ45_00045 [Erysipelotrichaceae bacterium]|nr:hypothetical protein [Erysipelotrichaceae bacterium]